MSRKKRNFVIGISLSIVFMVAISFAASFIVFYSMGYFKPSYEISFDPEKVDINNIRKFNEVRDVLNNKYYKGTDQNEILEGAIAGMAKSLSDPYTTYYNKEQFKAFLETSSKTEENYVGVGIPISLDENGLITVFEPYDDSPAKDAGVLQGDKIIKIDGNDVTGLRDESLVADMIKGPEGTDVIVTVFRPSDGRNIDFTLTRRRIKAVLNISSGMLSDKVGYIKIRMFDNDISNNFEKQLDKLIEQKMKGLIIDVRDNPGGSYEGVISIVDRLIPKGLIVYTEDKDENQAPKFSDARELDMPIAILINGNSASASEILAGAIKDHKKGVLIGTKTFGKGLVQEIYGLGDGSGIKVTVARYFTPSGVCIQGIGIQPDTEVQMPEKYKDLPLSRVPREEDIQLIKAVSVIEEQIAK